MADKSVADMLAEARRLMSELDLTAPEAARLNRRFIAICDAVKAPGAGEAAGQRRLSAFMAALERAARRSDPHI